MAGSNPVAEYWLPLAFQDAALIHSLIGCADVHVSGYKSIEDELRGLKHLQAAISIISRRLTGTKDATSCGTLTVVAGMAILEVSNFDIGPTLFFALLHALD